MVLLQLSLQSSTVLFKRIRNEAKATIQNKINTFCLVCMFVCWNYFTDCPKIYFLLPRFPNNRKRYEKNPFYKCKTFFVLVHQHDLRGVLWQFLLNFNHKTDLQSSLVLVTLASNIMDSAGPEKPLVKRTVVTDQRKTVWGELEWNLLTSCTNFMTIVIKVRIETSQVFSWGSLA